MLGLRGVYSQLLVENRPTLGGIATPFALEMIPGTWLDGIVLAKGASTVKQGNAGIAGQINADLVKPMFDKPLFVNVFTASEGRGELNVHLNRKKKVTANGLLLHGSFVENQWDMNRDRFYDMPNRQQLNGLYRWQYDGPAGCAQFNVQGLTDRRQSGQFRLQEGQTTPLFAVNQQNDRVEMWGKYGKEGIGGKPYQQLGNIASASWHRVNSQFGPNTYNATQQSAYFQTLFQGIFGNTNHQWVVAPSVQYDDIQEQVNEQDLSRRETQAGAMLEYTYSRPNLHLDIPDLVIVTGARLDWNTRFQRWMFTPRLSAKYNFTTESVVRLSAGRGFRSPNLMAENLSLLASNRRLDFEEGLGGQARDSWEEAWNYGLNYTHHFKLAHRKSSASIDLYRTDFVRQVLVDVDQSPTTVYFYQVPGKSFANSVLATVQTEVLPGFDVKLAYKWQDVRATYSDGVMRRAPLLPRHRGLVTLDYTTPSKRWMFNLRTQIVGPQRLPDNSQIPHELTHDFPEVSPTYALLSGQVTRRFNPKFEMYLGGENLGNFQQHHAIIAATDPSSQYFNGSQLWAPMGGTVVNLGLRYAPSGL
jgi:outer membrane receptor protein involved in Fe transport